jgi:hypothetical protein
MEEKSKMSKILALIIACIFIAGTLAQTSVNAASDKLRHSEMEGKVTVSNDIFTVTVVGGQTHPMFIWYYNNDNKTVYVVQYKGLTEYFDLGQKIYQRKFKADLEHLLRKGETVLADILANPPQWNGKTVTVFGELKSVEHHRGQTLPYNYELQQRNLRIGVNATANKYHGPVFVTGTVVAQAGKEVYIQASSIYSHKDLLEDLKALAHPPFFEFNQGKWAFSGFKNVTAPDGKPIGLAFNFTLTEMRDPNFKWLQNNLVLRCRIYNITAQESVKTGNGTSTYTVTKAELKCDFILKSWHWLLTPTTAEKTGLPVDREQLALWLELTTRHVGTPQEAEHEEEGAPSIMKNAKIGEHEINIRKAGEKEGEDEHELPTQAGKLPKIEFMNETGTLGGYFKFVDQAKVTYPNGASVAVPVKAAYLSDEGKLRLFLCYPYFADGTLEHDPIMGVTAPTVSETPQYDVSVAEGLTPATVTQAFQLISPLTIGMIAVAAAVAIVLVVFKLRRGLPPIILNNTLQRRER